MKPMNMQGSSETTSEESDHHQEDQDDDYTSAKRSYDCTFCRRGFTNAQALGGHMNIHRKEKAKAKLGTTNSSLPNKFTDEESMASSLIPQISSQTSTCYPIFESQRNYDDNIRFQPSSAPPYPINPPAYAFQYEFLNPTRYHQSLSTNQELLGPNLSLQIGPSHVNTDQARRGIQKDGEAVDLELRLGHDPY